MAAHEFTVTGDPSRVKQTAIDAFESRQFKMHWVDEWTGRAEKGSKIKNMLLGAFAQYFELGVAIRSLDATNSIIAINTLSKGWMGGAVGASRTKKNFAQLRDELGTTFQNAGVLVSHRDPEAQ